MMVPFRTSSPFFGSVLELSFSLDLVIGLVLWPLSPTFSTRTPRVSIQMVILPLVFFLFESAFLLRFSWIGLLPGEYLLCLGQFSLPYFFFIVIPPALSSAIYPSFFSKYSFARPEAFFLLPGGVPFAHIAQPFPFGFDPFFFSLEGLCPVIKGSSYIRFLPRIMYSGPLLMFFPVGGSRTRLQRSSVPFSHRQMVLFRSPFFC